MRIAVWVATILASFFAIVGTIYGLITYWEGVGTVGLWLCAGLFGMIGIYLYLITRGRAPEPADDPYGEIDEGAGDQGVYAPWSWWPLLVALSAAIGFLGLAAGWWIFFIGLASLPITLVGFVYEYNRGQHAH